MYTKIKKYKQQYMRNHHRRVIHHVHLHTLHLGAWLLTVSALLSFAKSVNHGYIQSHQEVSYVEQARIISMHKIEKTAHQEYSFDIGLHQPGLIGA